MRCDEAEGALSALVDGELDGVAASEVRAHLAACPGCAAALERLGALGTLAAGAATPVLSPRAAARILSGVLASAAPEAALADEVLTPLEVAALLKVPVAAVLELAGELPFFDVGGELRVRRCRVVAWIEERERSAVRREAAQVVRRARAR